MLRDLINQRLDALEKELRRIRTLLERMPEKPVKHYELDSLKMQVAALAEGLQELEGRVIQLEQHKSLASQLFRHGVSIALALLIAYLIGVIG